MKKLLLLSMLFISCTKEDSAKYCWECKSAIGNDLQAGGCNLSQSELQAQFDRGFSDIAGIVYKGENALNYCKKY